MLQFFESNLLVYLDIPPSEVANIFSVFKKIDDPSDNAGRDSAVAAPNSESTPATFMPPGLRSYQPSQTVRPPWDYGARFHTYTGSFGPNSIGTQPVTLIKNPMKQPAKVAEKEKTQADHNARLKSGARPILDTYVEHPVYDPEKRRMEAEIIRLKSQIKQNRKTQRESLRAEISKLVSCLLFLAKERVVLMERYSDRVFATFSLRLLISSRSILVWDTRAWIERMRLKGGLCFVVNNEFKAKEFSGKGLFKGNAGGFIMDKTWEG